ncbi:iron chelate uptake ABC transporter family permease subunit, partial [Escherichia coli]|uniref:iron chelate uptake ABC transporter family permease subunit n=1 Tax=Escherichia coli TaxID=562 RepID=UPI001124EBB1
LCGAMLGMAGGALQSPGGNGLFAPGFIGVEEGGSVGGVWVFFYFFILGGVWGVVGGAFLGFVWGFFLGFFDPLSAQQHFTQNDQKNWAGFFPFGAFFNCGLFF